MYKEVDNKIKEYEQNLKDMLKNTESKDCAGFINLLDGFNKELNLVISERKESNVVSFSDSFREKSIILKRRDGSREAVSVSWKNRLVERVELLEKRIGKLYTEVLGEFEIHSKKLAILYMFKMCRVFLLLHLDKVKQVATDCKNVLRKYLFADFKSGKLRTWKNTAISAILGFLGNNNIFSNGGDRTWIRKDIGSLDLAELFTVIRDIYRELQFLEPRCFKQKFPEHATIIEVQKKLNSIFMKMKRDEYVRSASSFCEKNDYENAKQFFKKYLKAYKSYAKISMIDDVSAKYEIARCYRNIGMCYFKLKINYEAKYYLDKAEQSLVQLKMLNSRSVKFDFVGLLEKISKTKKEISDKERKKIEMQLKYMGTLKEISDKERKKIEMQLKYMGTFFGDFMSMMCDGKENLVEKKRENTPHKELVKERLIKKTTAYKSPENILNEVLGSDGNRFFKRGDNKIDSSAGKKLKVNRTKLSKVVISKESEVDAILTNTLNELF